MGKAFLEKHRKIEVLNGKSLYTTEFYFIEQPTKQFKDWIVW